MQWTHSTNSNGWVNTATGWVQPVSSGGGTYTIQIAQSPGSYPAPAVAVVLPVAPSEPDPGQVEEAIGRLLELRRKLHS